MAGHDETLSQAGGSQAELRLLGWSLGMSFKRKALGADCRWRYQTLWVGMDMVQGLTYPHLIKDSESWFSEGFYMIPRPSAEELSEHFSEIQRLNEWWRDQSGWKRKQLKPLKWARNLVANHRLFEGLLANGWKSQDVCLGLFDQRNDLPKVLMLPMSLPCPCCMRQQTRCALTFVPRWEDYFVFASGKGFLLGKAGREPGKEPLGFLLFFLQKALAWAVHFSKNITFHWQSISSWWILKPTFCRRSLWDDKLRLFWQASDFDSSKNFPRYMRNIRWPILLPVNGGCWCCCYACAAFQSICLTSSMCLSQTFCASCHNLSIAMHSLAVW